MNKLRWHWDQVVTDGEMNLAFDQVEAADHALASDLGLHGILAGAVVVPRTPLPSLGVTLTGPSRAYDHRGRRVVLPAAVDVPLDVDTAGVPTEVASAGHERWVSISLRFLRVAYEPRTDGNSQQVLFRQDEGAEVIVRMGAEAPAGVAVPPPLDPEALLVCDVRRVHGQAQIVATDLVTARRQAFVLAPAASLGVEPGLWQLLVPAAPTVQAALDAADLALAQHVTGQGLRHPAHHVDIQAPAWLSAPTVQAVVDELVAGLAAQGVGAAGASRVGAAAVAGVPGVLAAGTVQGQLAALLGQLNTHVGAAAAAHAASAVGFVPGGSLAATNVQAAFEEVLADLRSAAVAAPGATLVGNAELAGAPVTLPAGSVAAQLGRLLASHNTHVSAPAGAHPATAVAVADAADRFLADTVEGALAELMAGYSAEHLRPAVSGASALGWHRAIHQPPMGIGATTLVWQSQGSGIPSTFRVYTTPDGVVFTVNAAWNLTTSAWEKDAAAGASVALLLNQTALQLQFHTGAAAFAAWPRVWRILMSGATGGSAFEVLGQVTETGRCSCEGTNTATIARSMTLGGTVNLRSRLIGAPSSVTLATTEATAFVGTPVLVGADRDGFAFESTQLAAAGAHVRWRGRYTVVA